MAWVKLTVSPEAVPLARVTCVHSLVVLPVMDLVTKA